MLIVTPQIDWRQDGLPSFFSHLLGWGVEEGQRVGREGILVHSLISSLTVFGAGNSWPFRAPPANFHSRSHAFPFLPATETVYIFVI